MDRVFIDEKGLFYKAAEPIAPNHLEKVVISAEGLQALSSVPISQSDWDDKVKKIVDEGTVQTQVEDESHT